MIISKILPSLLQDSGKSVSVSIIDSGFSRIPSYAKIYGYNNTINCQHGDKVLAVFTALDKTYPIKNLTLNLVCYNPKTEYNGLIKALKSLPHSDILSLSIAWKQHNEQVKNLLFEKADKICVPYSKNGENPYPSTYDGVINCSYMKDFDADYSINAVPEYKGNSFAVPAIARLLAYNCKLEHHNYGTPVVSLFHNYNELRKTSVNLNKTIETLKCPYCKKRLISQYHTSLIQYPEKCPYCGMILK